MLTPEEIKAKIKELLGMMPPELIEEEAAAEKKKWDDHFSSGMGKGGRNETKQWQELFEGKSFGEVQEMLEERKNAPDPDPKTKKKKTEDPESDEKYQKALSENEKLRKANEKLSGEFGNLQKTQSESDWRGKIASSLKEFNPISNKHEELLIDHLAGKFNERDGSIFEHESDVPFTLESGRPADMKTIIEGMKKGEYSGFFEKRGTFKGNKFNLQNEGGDEGNGRGTYQPKDSDFDSAKFIKMLDDTGQMAAAQSNQAINLPDGY